MPHYMDVHTGMHDLSIEDLERAHLRDVEAQGLHGVIYKQFFHSQDTGQVFCLAEGPNPAACEAVHVEANGMRAETIIEVEPAMFHGFMGGGRVTDLGASMLPNGDPDTGMRAILFTDIVGSTALTVEFGDQVGLALVEAHDRVTKDALERHEGRRVHHTGDGVMASFARLPASVAFAVDVQRSLAAYRAEADALPLEVRVGIHAGEPVPSRGDFFGIAVNVASRICDAAAPNEILISDAILEQITDTTMEVEPRGERHFKGLSAAMQVHGVRWT